MPQENDVTVHIHPPAITCTPKGGHVHCKPRDQFRWRSEPPSAKFTLTFQDFDTGLLVPWPFDPPEPSWPVSDTGLHTIMTTTLLKYTVRSTGCTDLDPIIIVDKTPVRPPHRKATRAKTNTGKAKSARAKKKR